jgi:hypothetical protein
MIEIGLASRKQLWNLKQKLLELIKSLDLIVWKYSNSIFKKINYILFTSSYSKLLGAIHLFVAAVKLF